VPTSEQVLGFPLGSEEVTTADSDTFLDAVDAASDRVTSGIAATSVEGRPLRYAIVGDPANATPEGLAAVQAKTAELRDPDTTRTRAAELAAQTPVILWVAGNVHGGEESGTDASLRILYDLADRDDCVVERILDEAIVVILPIQNPDGREAGTRRNVYGFDMNRDWFARTQPETDGKLELVRQFPPALFLDVHEFGFKGYFFPPNADPVYHEIPERPFGWINDMYAAAIETEFERQDIPFFHGAPYDLFAIVFGDTVPTEGFHAAGITLEKNNGDPIAERTEEHYVASWVSLFEGASVADDIQLGTHESFVEAVEQGEDGILEPNAVFEPGNDLLQPVPNIQVRHYFIRDDPDRAYETQLLVRRLQRMDVEVFRLRSQLTVPDFRAYGEPAARARLPAGTYWIPMAQAQKHWVQAMLNEDTYIPFPVTFDVTAWSNPLLMNLRGGWSGRALDPQADAVAAVDEPPWPGVQDTPSVGLFEIPNSTRGFESAGHTRYLFEQVWHLPYRAVTAGDIAAGLSGVDVLVVPDGFTNYALQALGAAGKKALRDWVNAGGRFVGWQGGAEVAARIGVSTARFSMSHTNAPGTLVRVALDPDSPLAAGVGSSAWVMYEDDDVLRTGLGQAAATFPLVGSNDFAVSGLAEGMGQLEGSSAIVDEAVGAGRAIVFSVDPNFRAWTQGTQRILWNAIVGADPAGIGAAAPAGSASRVDAELAARRAARALPEVGSAIRIVTARADAAAVGDAIRGFGGKAVRVQLGRRVLFLLANLDDLTVEEHPFALLLVRSLSRSGLDVRSFSAP